MIRVPDFGEPEAREHDLDAEVVFLVDHDGDVFQRADGDAARAVAGGQLAGDELALDQELAVEVGQAVDVEVRELELGVRERPS